MYTKEIEKFKKDILNNIVDSVIVDDSILAKQNSDEFFPIALFYEAIQQSFLDEFQLNVKLDDSGLDAITKEMAKKMNLDFIRFAFKKLDDNTVYLADINSIDINKEVNSVVLRFEEGDGEIQMYPIDSDFDNMNDWLDNRASKYTKEFITVGKLDAIQDAGIGLGEYTMVMLMMYILNSLAIINSMSNTKVLKQPQKRYVNLDSSNKKGKSKSKSKGPRRAKIVSSFYISREDLEDNDVKREYNKTMESWTVKGHTRTYKNGKTVWIAPYTKGRGKKVPKQYEL